MPQDFGVNVLKNCLGERWEGHDLIEAIKRIPKKERKEWCP